MDCIFCSIVAGKVPAEIVYSGHRVLAFLDVQPIHPGHVLIIPKQHYSDLIGLPGEYHEEIMAAAQTIAGALIRSLDLKGFNLFSNNGAIAGQSVFHFHLHVTPRYQDDNIRFVHGTKMYGPGEMTLLGSRIRQAIRKIESSKEQ